MNKKKSIEKQTRPEDYTQGFLDGIRSNLDNLAEAYKRDLGKEVEA